MSRGDGLARLRQALEDHGSRVQGNAAQCPAHEDRQASLSIGQGRDGAILKCHVNPPCPAGAILEALGMSAADLFDEPRGADDWTPAGPAIATYTYTDAAGKVLFGVCRTAGKQFPQWRPDPSKRHGRAWSVRDISKKLVPYRLPRVLAAVDAGELVYIAEGEKDVHALEHAGVTATCNPMGAGKWRDAYSKHLAGAVVIVIADNDPPGIAHARDVAAKLDGIAAAVTIVTAAEGKDAADHLAAGHGIGDFRPAGDSDVSGTPSARPVPDVPAMTMTQVEAVYARWLHDEDSVTTRVCHAVYVANMVLPGDPVWVFLVGGSGQGKTERLVPLAGMPHVVLASTLSGEAALLSATARRDRAEHAHGGLLRRVGGKGVLIIKDFTSILEMDRTARGQVLAALREVYDGRWDREVGAEGGQTLTWKGKCGVLAACTTAIDRAHAVMNDMGPRSLFVRLPPADPATIGKSALAHMGRETAMRSELANATAGMLAHLSGRPHDTGPVSDGLVGLAALVSLARSPVHRDWSGEVELVGDPEAPTRIIKQLGQLWRACGVLGLSYPESWEVVARCALDSVPKLRGAVIRYLAAQDKPANTTTVRIALAHPKRTVLRALEDLAAHHVITRESAGQGHADEWELSDRARSWITWIEGVPKTLESRPCTVCGGELDQSYIDAGFTDHGEAAQ